jgi:DNA repair exonuclease SbcCD ATPase subunit
MSRRRQAAIAALMVIAASGLPMLAETQSTDPLTALLNEVHQLRLTMERAATTAPEVQLLSARLRVQNERVSTASRDVAAIRREIDDASLRQAALKTEGAKIEDALPIEVDPGPRRELVEHQARVKEVLEQLRAQEQRLRAHEAELSSYLAEEQTQWMELNRRLDELERQIASRRPK